MSMRPSLKENISQIFLWNKDYCKIVARRKFLWISRENTAVAINFYIWILLFFQFARWLPNHLQYPPLGQVWSHGNWTRIGNCWENQEHARASPRWKITLDFFFYFFGILLLKLFWPTVRKSCSSDREKLLKFGAEGREFAKF